jgi:hypothetical protein
MTNRFTIVYKTYSKDLQWLKYSLQSVDKFVRDVQNIIIYYHDVCYKELADMLQQIQLKQPFFVRLIPVNYDIHGYLKQMVIKCMCFEDVSTDYIVFVDCDVIFKSDYSPNLTFTEDEQGTRIKWYVQKKNASNQNGDQWKVWAPSVEKMTRQSMSVYYMNNGFPFVVKKSTLHMAHDKFVEMHGCNYFTFCKKYLDEKRILPSMPIAGPKGRFLEMAAIFEEFEYIGWYAAHFDSDNYVFVEEPSQNANYQLQFWSHGGLTMAIEDQIKSILHH